MKRLLALLFAVVSVVALQAQTQDNAMYIYRNDGGFNAFLREDIDSITLSHFDIDSIQHQEPVCQVFHTPDSIYRIPIAAIDSVAFVQPETIYKNNVIRINDWIPYLSSVDSTQLALTFLPESPYSACKGDVLIFDQFTKELPRGFAGKINKIDNSNGITFVCDSASIEDVFEQFVIINDYENNGSNRNVNEKEHNPKRVNYRGEWIDSVKISLEYPFKEENDNKEEDKINAKIKLTGLLNLYSKLNVIKLKERPFYISLLLGGNISIALNGSIQADIIKTQIPSKKKINDVSRLLAAFPVPDTPFMVGCSKLALKNTQLFQAH